MKKNVSILATAAIIFTFGLLGYSARALNRTKDSPGQLSFAEASALAAGGTVTGNPKAHFMITEFADFECPVCQTMQGRIKELQRKFPNEVAVSFRHYPLAGHFLAYPAAVWSECAAKQGKFAEYSDEIFSSQMSLDSSSWSRIAQTVKIPDMVSFTQCYGDATVAARIRDDIAAARSLRIKGTPMFVINGKVFMGSLSSKTLEELLQHTLNASTR